jgi:fatty acid desaturase
MPLACGACTCTRTGAFNRFRSFLVVLLSILLTCHGKIVGSYLVHEAAHGTIFARAPAGNAWFGRTALVAAGCPYVDFRHVRKMHLAHHKDRADVVSFDFRAFVNQQRLPSAFVCWQIILGCEFLFLPIVETFLHVRVAIYPIIVYFRSSSLSSSSSSSTTTTATQDGEPDEGETSAPIHPDRVRSAVLGGSLYLVYWTMVWRCGMVIPCLVAGLLVLQFLMLNDAFHHTF